MRTIDPYGPEASAAFCDDFCTHCADCEVCEFVEPLVYNDDFTADQLCTECDARREAHRA